jgi:hypothetical protein
MNTFEEFIPSIDAKVVYTQLGKGWWRMDIIRGDGKLWDTTQGYASLGQARHTFWESFHEVETEEVK